MSETVDYFWHSNDGWRYLREGVEVGPFDTFEMCVKTTSMNQPVYIELAVRFQASA